MYVKLNRKRNNQNRIKNYHKKENILNILEQFEKTDLKKCDLFCNERNIF